MTSDRAERRGAGAARLYAGLLCAGLLFTGCGEASDTGDETGTEAAADVPATPATEPLTDVREVSWAPRLDVDLAGRPPAGG